MPKPYRYFVSFAYQEGGLVHLGRTSAELDHPLASSEELLEVEEKIRLTLPEDIRGRSQVAVMYWRRFESEE